MSSRFFYSNKLILAYLIKQFLIDTLQGIIFNIIVTF